ncbi:M23 family metallopeptidase [Microlunatus sp. Y2014]|uniref:M23 family metallopeptidase n=1 Tax=Microlunatus sp. Y2014 TaxID=3418488 RepID=UPI003DA740F6
METKNHPVLSCALKIRATFRPAPRTTGRPRTDAETAQPTTRRPARVAARTSRDAAGTNVGGATKDGATKAKRAAARRGKRTEGEVNAWVRNLAAVSLVSALGIGVAGALSAPGTAISNPEPPAVQVSIDPNVRQPAEFNHRGERTNRSLGREAINDRRANLRAQSSQIARAQAQAALESRTKKLGESATNVKKNAEAINSRRVSRMPLDTYTITGRWGAVGPWARYHTGVDLAAPVGTTIYAPAAGVVVHAGSGGGAGSWAGCYVVVKHNDGQQSLYAHMSCGIPVSVGQQVTGGTVLGQVGMTGRTFGPHLHMELYPIGTTYGDIYTSIDPLPWLRGS